MSTTKDGKNKVIFHSEFKSVSSRKTSSLDKEYTVKLVTGDQAALLLDNFATDEMLRVTVEVAE